ncbi:MAG: LysR family transcriptional regulator [Chloroflexota bacterium]
MISEPDRWLDLDLRHLAALQAIATQGSFHRAAEHLGYTQSAVSQQIAALERIVDTRLVHRPGGPRPISLTEAGEVMVRHADAMLARLHAAEADLSSLGCGEAGTLRVGSYQSVGRGILPKLMREFTDSWPQVQITLIESVNDNDLWMELERGALDLSFVMLPAPEGPFEHVELMCDPYVLVVPADSPLAERESVDVSELAGQPLIGFLQCRSMLQVETSLRASGIEPDFVFRSADNGTVQGLVAAGVGVALSPTMAVEPGDGAVRILRLSPELPARRIAMAWHKDRYRSPAMKAFTDAALELCARL